MRRITAWKTGYLSLGVIFVLIGVLVGHYLEELFGMFFGIFGLSLLLEAIEKVLSSFPQVKTSLKLSSGEEITLKLGTSPLTPLMESSS